MNRTTKHLTRGTIFVHSSPAALCPHVEWAVAGALDARVSIPWIPQPAEPGSRCGEIPWQGRPGTGALLASTLVRLGRIRFEITEHPSPGVDGQRFMFTPALGSFTATVGAHGDILVPEDRLRSAAASGDLYHAVDQMLGRPWDDELEFFRHAAEDAPARWLHQVV